ncbi:MAG: CRISPR system precrRNA processing endoribonuclease RAMP protein Cas6 [Desulfobacteraceae bacterium]|nr:MAG: CRISPR system precrRNA processing endoribonuclease RAMP protein Cas6 [Desulfobacteraceae bacterium]
MNGSLSFLKFNAIFRVTRSFELQEFTGMTFHRMMGWAFSKVAFGIASSCDTCPCRPQCRHVDLFTYFTRSPADHPFIHESLTDIPLKQETYPPPYVLDPPDPRFYPEGSAITLGITLIGKAISLSPFVFCALKQFRFWRIGNSTDCMFLEAVIDGLPQNSLPTGKFYDVKTDRPYVIDRASNYNFETVLSRLETSFFIQEPIEEMVIEFLTPFRYKSENRIGRTLDFPVFIRNILRRLTLLSVHSPPVFTADFRSLVERAKGITALPTLEWREFRHISSKEKKVRLFGGYVGEIRFSGDLAAFLSYIKMGEYLHVGKNTSFGFGKYRIIRSEL